MLRCVAVCCSVLQCVAVRGSLSLIFRMQNMILNRFVRLLSVSISVSVSISLSSCVCLCVGLLFSASLSGCTRLATVLERMVQRSDGCGGGADSMHLVDAVVELFRQVGAC